MQELLQLNGQKYIFTNFFMSFHLTWWITKSRVHLQRRQREDDAPNPVNRLKFLQQIFKPHR